MMIIRGPLGLGLAAITLLTGACSKDWETFRHDAFATAHQPNATDLSDPAKIPNLNIDWQWQMPAITPVSATGGNANARSFRASPVVDDDRVFIGGGDGIFRAFDANNGNLLWQFPTATQISNGSQPPLLADYVCNPSSKGIASSAAIASINGVQAVIFGAPDSTTQFGSGRLFALNAQTGAEIWRSDVVAIVNGLTPGNGMQLHEQIGYSTPLVYNSSVYVGVANHCDNPIQQGKIRKVSLSTGTLDAGFDFVGAAGPGGSRALGGGVWTHIATDLNQILTTTGNIKSGNP
ncbi:MAG: PQQ-binding-like beta-propeller repeat protein, partial [Pseudomonadota bacterium]